MKHIIKTFKYVREEGHEIEFEMPTETIYLFETGVRRSVKIIPQYTTWLVDTKGKDKEEIWRYDFICVHNSFESKMYKESIQVHEFERLYNSNERSIEKGLLELLVSGHGLKRTEEQFESDFNECLRKLTQ